jgi:hypothetical protein
MARHRKDAPKPGRTVLEKRQAKQEKKAKQVTARRRKDALSTSA